MRKHDEGYALVLVLVVLIVLGLLSTTILTGAQRNIEVHRSSVETMQNKYQAMGEIEKIIGALETHIGEQLEILKATGDQWELAYDHEKNEIRMKSSYGNVQIDCILRIEGAIIDGVDAIDVRHLLGYTITSYVISTIGGAN